MLQQTGCRHVNYRRFEEKYRCRGLHHDVCYLIKRVSKTEFYGVRAKAGELADTIERIGQEDETSKNYWKHGRAYELKRKRQTIHTIALKKFKCMNEYASLKHT